MKSASKEKMCPIFIAAWINHYGNYDNMGQVGLYCHCDNDCAWYDGGECKIAEIARGIHNITAMLE